jgi:SAM-dependent methyltransferase
MSGEIREGVARYYSGRLAEHGPTPAGVDWNSADSQELRFRELLRLCDTSEPFSLNDYGCGYGALLSHLQSLGHRFEYCGADLSADMVAAAREAHGTPPGVRWLTDPAELSEADYTVASGIFNVKGDVPDAAWRAYMEETVDHIARLSRRGFAFNVLTLYSDEDKRRPDLHYADPLYWFDRCKRHYARKVALLHDSPLWEFTILVRRDSGSG